ncbi:aldehyde dehydrogenase family protein [Actinomadura nitritigenes]|uniref:aldehyde dehydrogenase family protein n=1 Tax=Actinomadura nitritigenes TaxID=134602 RepID=UPI0036BE85B5
MHEIIAEAGAPRMLTHGAQLDDPLDLVRYYAALLRDHPLTEDLGHAEYQGQRHHRWVEKEAAGVVAAITPYNFPVQLALVKLAPALAAGCTVVLKGGRRRPPRRLHERRVRHLPACRPTGTRAIRRPTWGR